MKKGSTPDPSVVVRVRLKTTKVDFVNLKEKANQLVNTKGRAHDSAIVAIDRRELRNLIADYEVLLRSLKNLGGFFSRELDYSETKEWKASIGKPLKHSEVPKFLRGPRRRVRL